MPADLRLRLVCSASGGAAPRNVTPRVRIRRLAAPTLRENPEPRCGAPTVRRHGGIVPPAGRPQGARRLGTWQLSFQWGYAYRGS